MKDTSKFGGPVLPNVLRIGADGTLFCADGRKVTEYLAEFRRHANITDDTPITIMRRDAHEQDREDAYLMRNFAS